MSALPDRHLRFVPDQYRPQPIGFELPMTMRLDHVSYAAGAKGLSATAKDLGDRLGIDVLSGGVHPAFGTRNKILPLCDGRYIEVVEVLEHPAAEKAPFGQAVRKRSDAGGGWMSWVVSTDRLGEVEERLGRSAVQGRRNRPDGAELRWQQIGVRGVIADPQLPFIIHWESPSDEHPSRAGRLNGVSLELMKIAGSPSRVLEWLGGEEEFGTDGVSYDFVAPHGDPGIESVTFCTPDGSVEI